MRLGQRVQDADEDGVHERRGSGPRAMWSASDTPGSRSMTMNGNP